MKPFRLHTLGVAAILLASVITDQAAAVNLEVTTQYATSGECDGSTPGGIPVSVTAVQPSGTCVASNACPETSTGSSLFPAISCSSTDGSSGAAFITADLPTIFGSNPYVVVEAYTAGQSCAADTDITSSKVYLADGICHKTGTSASYAATRAEDGSAVVKTYTDSPTCATTGTTLTVTAAQATGNSCANDANGILDTKIYGAGKTASLFKSTLSFSTASDSCKSPGVPTLVDTTVFDVSSATCTASSTCTGSAEPYTGTTCTSLLTYNDDMATMFGSNPYVIVKTYTAGQNCDPTKVASIATYLADGICHKTGNSASYAATRAEDGSAVVKTYTDSPTCATTGTTLTVTAAQATGNSCANDANGILDTKIYGAGKTASLFKSTLSFSTASDSCKSPGVPTLVDTTVFDVSSATCTASSTCTGSAEPYTGTTCTSLLTYNDDMATMFGSNPYVIVKTYTAGQNCDPTKVASIATYLADGICHKTGNSASYAATRAEDGSAVVKTYTDSPTCATTGTTLTVTAAQATGNSCASGANGILNTKVYGAGKTASLFKSTLSFSTASDSCKSPGVPTLVDTTVFDVSSATCTASSTCTGSAEPYTGTTCTSLLTYNDDMATMFGSSPYVIVKTYTAGQNCDPTKVASIATYLADGICHKTGNSASYAATRAEDGSAVVKTYTDSPTCATTGTTLTVTAAQATGNSCASGANGILNTKVYGAGKTASLFKSTLSFSTASDSCKSPGVPTLVDTTVFDVSSATCTASSTCTGSAEPYTGTTCTSLLTYNDDMATMFGSNPYVIVKTYTAGQNCDPTKVASIATYLADGICHKTGNSASYAATRAEDGSAVVKTYTDSPTCATTGTTLTVTAAQATGNSCASGANGILNTKVYGAGKTASLFKSTLSFSTASDSCKSPGVPTLVDTTVFDVSSATCTASSTCTGSAEPYTGTTCTSLLTYNDDMATMFGSSPYVIVKTYTAGQNCDPTKVASIATYLADGICHKTGNSASYAATRAEDGSAVVKTYTDSPTCATTGTTLTVTAAQTLGNSCTNDGSGILDKQVYGYGKTASLFKSTLSFSTASDSCKSPGVPTLVDTTVFDVSSATCTASSTCTGSAEPYTGMTCTSLLTYNDDMATMFGSNPYVIVQKHTAGQTCNPTKVNSIATYLADGKCHKTGASASYRATRSADGAAEVKTYTDSATCATAGTTLSVTAAQATGNSCANDVNGILDTKVYGGGATPLYLSSTNSYDTTVGSCKSPAVPTQVATSVVLVDVCSPSSTCTGSSEPYIGTSCSSTLTYKTDMAATFGSNPYVIVEKYTASQSCAASKLLGITTYLADGKCHKTGASASYRSTRKADGSATVKTYTDSATCATTGTTLTVTAAQATGNSCANDVNGILNTKIYGGGTTPMFYLTSTMSYSTDAGGCKSPAVPTQVVTSLDLADACTATSICAGSGEPYTGTACSSTVTYKTDMAAVFGSNPYVIVEKYTASQSCAANQLSAITTYLADGKCHKTGASASYRATRSADGAAEVKTYTDSATCATAGTTLSVTAAQATGNSCGNNVNGILDTKVYGGGATAFFLTVTASYDTNTGSCKSPAVPSLLAASVDVLDTCTASTTCSGSGDLFTGTFCGTLSTYKSDFQNAFGTNPYVIVKNYAAGKKCASPFLTSIAAYLADGKCRKTGASASYVATRANDGSAVVKTYTNSPTCATTGTTMIVTAAQATGNSCANDANGILNTKIYGAGKTASLFKSTLSFSTASDSCKSPGVPTLVDTTVFDVSSATCTASSTCTGSAEPYTGMTCTSLLTYNDDMATMFGSNPYVIVQKHTAGQTCNPTKVNSIATYLADGKCHKTGASASYRATRSADGAAEVKTYTDSATCATAGTTLSVTAAQATGNSCANDVNGILDTKVYGGGATPLYLSSTNSYDTTVGSCKSPAVPTQVATSVVLVDACTPSSTCTGSSEPYIGTSCSSTLTYKTDMTATFGSNPYVIVEKYTAGQSCAASKLLGITTYLADGKCHKTGASASYRATRSADGAAEVKTYTDSTTCATTGTTLSVTAAQATGNSCANDVNGILDTKVYGGGATPLYLSSTNSYDTTVGSCKSPAVPTQVATSVVLVDVCSPSSTCTGSSEPYTGTSCSSTLTYKTDMTATFGSNPYVIVEKYTAGQSCAVSQLLGITTYLADGKCHKTGASASYAATRAVDGSAVVKTYTDSATCATTGTTMIVTAAQATGNSCANGANGILNTKIYGAGKTASLFKSTLSFSTASDSCKSPGVPTLVDTTVFDVSSATCTASSTCTGSAEPYTGMTCTSLLTYNDDMATMFGSNPYVIVQKHTAGQTCNPTKVNSIATYLADGKCHKTGASASYRATRSADGAAEVKTYTDSATCATAGTTLSVTAAQATGNSCANDVNGILDTKVYGGGATPLYLSSTNSYDTTVGSCKSPAVPTQVATSVVLVDACTPSSTCTGSSEPYIGTSCSSTLTYKTDMTATFGSNPYVIVEKYTAGQSCAASKLLGITTYLADGKCHKTGASASYRATRSADGAAEVKTYTDSTTCATTGTTLSVTAAQATGNSCANDVNGILDTKVYGGGATPLYLSSTNSYDTTVGSCKSPAVPTQVATSVVLVDVCSPSSTCTGSSEPYIGTSCSSTLTYKTDMTATFGSNPYVIVEKYTAGQSCAASKLLGITTYLADGKCHKTGASASYRSTRKADGSATVKTYLDSAACATTGTTLTVTADQATGNSCANDANGIMDMKIYGGGATSVVWSTVAVFGGNSCASPTQMTFSSTYTCAATSGCMGFGERSISYACSNDYFAAANLAFGTKPYVVLELYKEESSCQSKEGVMVLSADQKCYLAMDASSSFTFTLGTDGSGTMVAYEDRQCKDATPITTPLTKAQLSVHECIGSSKYYAFNAPAPQVPPPTPAPTPAPTSAPTSAPTPAPTTATPTGSGSANTGDSSGAASLSAITTLIATGLWVFGWVANLLV